MSKEYLEEAIRELRKRIEQLEKTVKALEDDHR